MPRTIFEKPDPDAPLAALLRGTAITQGKNFSDLGKMIGCSSKTVTARFQRPESFTVGELRALQRGLKIPADDLRAAIKM